MMTEMGFLAIAYLINSTRSLRAHGKFVRQAYGLAKKVYATARRECKEEEDDEQLLTPSLMS